MSETPLQRAMSFAERFGLSRPIMLAPMAGACPPALSAAVANAGGLGACGAVLMGPAAMRAWAEAFRAASNGVFQMNLWSPDPRPVRDPDQERAMRELLRQWGPEVPAEAGDAVPQDYAAQCAALLEIAPPVVSSVMGLFPPEVAAALKARGIAWFATVSTLAEALAAEAAGADVIVAQGMEAGGHRGCFEAGAAEAQLVGTMALVPAIVDAVRLPVVATGGIADGRGVAAALALGACAAQIGTGFLRCPEASLPAAWAASLARAAPEGTVLTRAFTGRAGRAVVTGFVRATAAANAPRPTPFPVQRGLTAAMRAEAVRRDDLDRMQAWAGQSAALARAEPAAAIVASVWERAKGLLGGR